MTLRILLVILLFQNYAYAEESTMPESPKPSKAPAAETYTPKANKDADQHKKVIEEYKQFLSKIPEEVRDEVRNYRKEVIKLNKQKIKLYKKLSQEAQQFLNSERNFKKRLPFRDRRKIK